MHEALSSALTRKLVPVSFAMVHLTTTALPPFGGMHEALSECVDSDLRYPLLHNIRPYSLSSFQMVDRRCCLTHLLITGDPDLCLCIGNLILTVQHPHHSLRYLLLLVITSAYFVIHHSHFCLCISHCCLFSLSTQPQPQPHLHLHLAHTHMRDDVEIETLLR